jgi:uncharacterized membrane protein YedE/YeeE
MKWIWFLITGIFFGIVLTKAEVISWYRIQEMFRFQSFHMYGIIGSAVVLGIIIIQFVRKFQTKSIDKSPIVIEQKPKNFKAALIGGTIFGLGWAMTGACPGPIYILIGYGLTAFFVVWISAVLGALLYGVIRNRLPH